MVRIGLTSHFKSLLFDQAYFKSSSGLSVTGYQCDPKQIHQTGDLPQPVFSVITQSPIKAKAQNGLLTLPNDTENTKLIPIWLLTPKSKTDKIIISTDPKFATAKSYGERLMVIAQGNKIRLILIYPLEEYVQSVLQGEMPSSYHLEAIKAQAVCARTYALHPRVDHSADFCDVCDSYLCCQCFSSIPAQKNSPHFEASQQTAGQILTYNDKPILALFSSCAGGHTENYNDCFSDWKTNLFPPQPIPYLKGVSENLKKETTQIVDELTLKKLWHSSNPDTADSWSNKFRWSIKLSNQNLESQIHNNIIKLLEQPDFAPFISSPPSEIFGHILSFAVVKRASGGTIIQLEIETSKGNWQFSKELTIRNLFQNHSLNLKRLPSAKIFFDQILDNNQQLDSLIIYGLGSGHGVGLQQIGSEGHARQNKKYEQILSHYYPQTQLEKI